MNIKVQIIFIFIFLKKVSTNNFANLNRLPKIRPNLSAYRYEGNFYPSFATTTNTASKSINLNRISNKPAVQFIRYLNPVHLSHQIYHDAQYHDNQETLSNNNDATGSEYQVAMKVQPLLQRGISSGKTLDMEESGKSQAVKQLKIDILSPEKRHSLRNNQNGFYNQKRNESQTKSVVPNEISNISRNYHDIFLKYKSPQELVFGHVLSWPELAQKRLEKRDNNHFKGQVIWANKAGGYGEHFWDLAQGAL